MPEHLAMYVRRQQPSFPRRVRERGVVLLLALIFLLLLTLLAIGASSGSLLQQRMVSATRSAQLATMSADTALRGAEWQLWSFPQIAGTPFNCGAGAIDPTTGCVKYDPDSSLYSAAGDVTLFRTGNNAWLATGVAYKPLSGTHDFTNWPVADDQTASANVAENPHYIIERLGLVKSPGAGPQCESGSTGCKAGGPGQVELYTYRITARATGGSQNTVRVVQSTFDAQGNH